MDSRKFPQRQTPSGKEATQQVIFSNEDLEFLLVWRLDTGAHGLVRYLVRPRINRQVGDLLEAAVLPQGAPLEAYARQEEEVRLASLLFHPSIVRVHGLFKNSRETVMLSEHVEGCNLDTVLSFSALRGKRPSEAFSLYVISMMAGALHHAHTLKDAELLPLGIIHRAVSPMWIRIGLRGEVKLMNFASAYSLLPGRVGTPKGMVRGEIEYAAPERLLVEGEDARSDIFSLGAVLLEMLMGRALYDLEAVEAEARKLKRARKAGSRLRAEIPGWVSVADMARRALVLRPEHVEDAMREVSEPVKAILRKALCRHPDGRHATAAELQAELQAGLRALGVPSYGPQEVARELLQARAEAEASPQREDASLLEPGVFSDDVPGGSKRSPPWPM